MSVLEIRGLQVSVNTENGSVEILKGVDQLLSLVKHMQSWVLMDLVNQLLLTPLQATLNTQSLVAL